MARRIAREGGSLEDYFSTQEFFAQWWQLPILVEDDPYMGMEYQGDMDRPQPTSQVLGPDDMLASWYLDHTCDILCACTYVGPHPPMGYQRRTGRDHIYLLTCK